MARFDYFIVLAEMRTGSNFLEANLNAFPGLTCHGEAFNPVFIGYPKNETLLGLTLDERQQAPQRLLDAVKADHGLAGFRFFHDHDPRVLDVALPDPRCAKIILTRNPVDSYVSWKIARATDQWKLTDVRRRKESKVDFDPVEFEAHLETLQSFQIRVMNALQVTGQTAFYVDYDDLQSLDVMNGLGAFLGQKDKLESLDSKLKRQNPEPLDQKVEDFDGLEAALARLDRFNLNRTPNFEPRRGARVPEYVAGTTTPLLYLPVRNGLEDRVRGWLAALEGVAAEDLPGAFTQKSLRQWKRARPGHRSFTVVRHPLVRAHAVFCERILMPGPNRFGEIRRVLRKRYNLPIPADMEAADYPLEQHRAAFRGFLDFLKANLAGQTTVRQESAFATQAGTVESMGLFALPDLILREEELTTELPALARRLGHPAPVEPLAAEGDAPYPLAEVADAELAALCAEIYQRDYMIFGFDPASPV
ncbi:nodulation protein NodH [Pseudooceanicola nanhaiensis]|uniref:nodulation protein NodH n=1 Tax=Pseudooceanicola nanhaiensis TaxID=375761 RepID=UPI001CD32325|nr:nodulation protein NodH [Pseudooceanicola nanhaiensis]MCA0920337.1 nodulation protein NodH [Pseudooceanicola nanhaiensis]